MWDRLIDRWSVRPIVVGGIIKLGEDVLQDIGVT
jgi:hypothetical protein